MMEAMADEDDDSEDEAVPDVVEMPIEDVIDLHTFHPRDVAELVTDWLHLCVEKGFVEVRIIHGKGKGVLRTIVHGVLAKHPAVAGFALADGSAGSWGATLVRLKHK
jgi:DNA-nicking Smr family endonuclease